MIPLPASKIADMWKALIPYDFKSTHGAFPGMDVRDSNLKSRVWKSAQIQIEAMGGRPEIIWTASYCGILRIRRQGRNLSKLWDSNSFKGLLVGKMTCVHLGIRKEHCLESLKCHHLTVASISHIILSLNLKDVHKSKVLASSTRWMPISAPKTSNFLWPPGKLGSLVSIALSLLTSQFIRFVLSAKHCRLYLIPPHMKPHWTVRCRLVLHKQRQIVLTAQIPSQTRTNIKYAFLRNA